MRRFWAYWDAPDLLPQRLRLFRVGFFGLLAFDLWVLMLPHAGRYGAGDLNVAHFGWLDGVLPAPTPGAVGLLYLVGGFLALRVALGVATRVSVVLLTGIYNGVYYWSQVDSYQHHYLIGIVLLLLCFVPFERLEKARTPVSCWAMKLLYAQVAIVYLYTAVTKMSPQWLDGSTFSAIAQDEGVRSFQSGLAGMMGWEPSGAWVFAAYAVMIWQLVASASFLWKWLRPIACITGPAFHVLVEFLDLKIGWFSYYMIAIYYILLFPETWFLYLARPIKWLLDRLAPVWEAALAIRFEPSAPVLLAVSVGSGVLGAVLAAQLPVEGATGIAVVLGLLIATGIWVSARPAHEAVIQVATAAAMLLAVTASDSAYDYYRFWAGDSARRGRLQQAAVLYEKANALRPGAEARRPKLARIYRQMGRTADAERVEAELRR